MNHEQQSSTQESPSIVTLGAREWKNGVACNLVEGFLSGMCFALSEMGVEGAGGGFIGERGCSRGVWSGSDGAGDTRQQARHGEGGPVAGDDGGGCATKGGAGGGGGAHGGEHACGGHG